MNKISTLIVALVSLYAAYLGFSMIRAGYAIVKISELTLDKHGGLLILLGGCIPCFLGWALWIITDIYYRFNKEDNK